MTDKEMIAWIAGFIAGGDRNKEGLSKEQTVELAREIGLHMNPPPVQEYDPYLNRPWTPR